MRPPRPAPLLPAKWLRRARPIDCAIAVSDACAALPVIGKHLAPVGVVAAMGAWCARNAPTVLGSAVRRKQPNGADALIPGTVREQTTAAAAAALSQFLPIDRLDVQWAAEDRLPPVLRAGRQRQRFLYRSSVRYGSAPEQVLDVWRRPDLPNRPAPVLVFVPGGAWIIGERKLQGYTLMSHLAAQGWICLSVGYRVSPRHRWPRHILDVKAAVAWARANADKFGGDRNFVAIAGCSAGGHLAALTGLTCDDREFSAELAADADTSVDAVVGIYGRYDWEDRSAPQRAEFVRFLEGIVVRKTFVDHPDVFRKASPITHVRSDAPPFLVVHGTNDTVIPVDEARAFVERLHAVSRSTVSYLELPGAGHGFDLVDRARTGTSVTAIGLFLNEMHRNHLARLVNPAS
ncbi:esterase [Mycobacterium sp. MFM001]|uniref:alpha/beta hydrolase n=1 Tax=Mycobacterium sp. MFM001 TaxID=2049453 RepID=UPI000DA5D7E6|nr:alpha/beta hydrolase [Mycobacterium sp. MFM001]GBE67582.1 esterase [Mycobacterium sp. MFM001]